MSHINLGKKLGYVSEVGHRDVFQEGETHNELWIRGARVMGEHCSIEFRH